jgi:cyanophycinase
MSNDNSKGHSIESTLIIIGGAEDKKGKKTILHEVCSKLNKEDKELVIATVATEQPKEVGAEYTKLFKEMNVKNISVLNVENREDAYRQDNVSIVNRASLIFFTGGDQLRITSILGGTPLYTALKERYTEGCIFVGTSAGASVMSDTMVTQGTDEESPKKCTLKMAPGLGLIKGVIIDQHFAQRGRIGRLLVGIAENPQCLGIGIDEDTAIEVNDKGIFKVLGSSAVYVVDGSGISHSNVSEQYPDDILSIFDVKMHVLKSGDRYDLNTRRPFEELKE